MLRWISVIVMVVAGVIAGFWFFYMSGFFGALDRNHFPLRPAPGYAWAKQGQWSFATVWAPGSENPSAEHVVADERENAWIPAAAYEWNTASKQTNFFGGIMPFKYADEDLSVHWKAGERNPKFAHIWSGEAEGTWTPDDGYRFKRPGQALDVVWVPGTRDPHFEHQIAGNIEGSWVMEAGYVKRPAFLGEIAEWTPATPYPGQPCLVAASAEGQWRAADGYTLSFPSPGIIEVVSVPTIDTGKVIVGIGATVVSLLIRPKSDDDSFTGGVGRIASDEGIKAGIGAVADGLKAGPAGSCSGVRLAGGFKPVL